MNIFDIMGPIMVGPLPQPMSHGPGTPPFISLPRAE